MNLLYTLLLLFGVWQVVTSEDPCINYSTFPTSHVGSRNERCMPVAAPVCDYYLHEGWYALEEGIILTHCPTSGNCGVGYPAWMNGTLPEEVEGIVTRTVCIKGLSDCCNATMDIKVRRCSGLYVYYLTPLDFCPAGYCFESTQPCVQPTSQPTTPPKVPDDPCRRYTTFPKQHFGSRNERCTPPVVPVCDYYLKEDWYRVEEGTLLSHCPVGDCGVGYPVWLNGSLPGVTDGIVERYACVKDNADCCKEAVKVRIKQCGQYHVYHFPALNGCPYGYCFESTQPCVVPTTLSFSDNSSDEFKKKDQDSHMLLIALMVTTALVLVIVIVILILIGLHKGSKRNKIQTGKITEYSLQKSSTTMTKTRTPVTVYYNDYNIPAKTPPPAYS